MKLNNKTRNTVIISITIIILAISVILYINYSERKAYYEEEYIWNCDAFKILSRTALNTIQSLDLSKEDHHEEIDQLNSIKEKLIEVYYKLDYLSDRNGGYAHKSNDYYNIIESLDLCISQLQESSFEWQDWIAVSSWFITDYKECFPE